MTTTTVHPLGPLIGATQKESRGEGLELESLIEDIGRGESAAGKKSFEMGAFDSAGAQMNAGRSRRRRGDDS